MTGAITSLANWATESRRSCCSGDSWKVTIGTPSHSPLQPGCGGGSLTALTTRHESENMASLSCPDCGVKIQPEDLICFRCGANLPHTPYPDDDVPTPTVSQQYLQPGPGRAP